MSYFGPKDFGFEVSKGNVARTTGITQGGRNNDIDTGTIPEDVWTQGGVWVPPTTARIHDIVSTSANDTSAGTGARTVSIVGLNGSYAIVSETVTMNGLSNVATVNSYVYIKSMIVVTAGSGGVNAGAITATAQTDATVTIGMYAGTNISQLAIYQVPAGYTGYITKIGCGIQQATATAYADITLFVKPFNGVWSLRTNTPLSNSGGSILLIELDTPIKLLEKEMCKMQVTQCSDNNTDIHSIMFLYLVQN